MCYGPTPHSSSNQCVVLGGDVAYAVRNVRQYKSDVARYRWTPQTSRLDFQGATQSCVWVPERYPKITHTGDDLALTIFASQAFIATGLGTNDEQYHTFGPFKDHSAAHAEHKWMLDYEARLARKEPKVLAEDVEAAIAGVKAGGNAPVNRASGLILLPLLVAGLSRRKMTRRALLGGASAGSMFARSRTKSAPKPDEPRYQGLGHWGISVESGRVYLASGIGTKSEQLRAFGPFSSLTAAEAELTWVRDYEARMARRQAEVNRFLKAFFAK